MNRFDHLLTKGTLGTVAGHCVDGRAIIQFDDHGPTHTFHFPEFNIEIWSGLSDLDGSHVNR